MATAVDWLRSSKPGHCGATDGGREGPCDEPLGARHGRGSFSLANFSDWPTAVALCQAQCASCANCNWITVSLRWRDCSWYSHCPATDDSRKGFKSGAFDHTSWDRTHPASSRAPPPYRLRVNPVTGDPLNEPYCTGHWCAHRCCPLACSRILGASAHVLFAHVEKTGGSAIECATQQWQRKGWWTNMGHTTSKALSACAAKCDAGTPTVRVVTVRDPYSYWASVYGNAWRGPMFKTRRVWQAGREGQIDRCWPKPEAALSLAWHCGEGWPRLIWPDSEPACFEHRRGVGSAGYAFM